MNQISEKSHCHILIALWTISAILLVIPYPIASSSEAREAHVIADIVLNGNWLFPTRAGIIPSKPPLYHWFGGVLGFLTGSTAPWVGRIVSILSGAVVALATLRLARVFTSRWWINPSEARDDGSADWGVVRLSLLTVLSAHLFMNLAINARVDMLFVALSTLSLSVILPFTRDKTTWRKRGWGVESLFWFLIGLAILARGVVGLVFPTGVLFLALWMRLGLWSAIRWFLIPPILSIIAIILPFLWYIPAALHWGVPFLERFIFENIDRVSGGGWIDGQPWWFYGPSLVRTVFPWSILFLISLVRRGYNRKEMRVLLVAVFFGLTIFSISEGKRHSYLLPLLPPLAVMTAHYIAWELRRFSESAREKLWRWYSVLELFLLAVPPLLLATLFGLISKWWSFKRADPILPFLNQWFLSSALIIGIVWLLAGGVRFRLQDRGDRLSRLSVIVGIVPLMIIAIGLGIKNTVKDFPNRTDEIISRFNTLSTYQMSSGSATPTIVVFKELAEEYLDPIMYYSRVPVRVKLISRGHDQLLSPLLANSVPEVAQLLAKEDERGKVPCGTWLLTVPKVVDDARNEGITVEHYEEFLEPTHKAGVSPQRADRTAVITRFRAPPEKCLDAAF